MKKENILNIAFIAILCTMAIVITMVLIKAINYKIDLNNKEKAIEKRLDEWRSGDMEDSLIICE